jgi:prepilin-type N-terminal cleavage/methylation domain-containing protein
MRRGFSIVELVVVAGIVAVLAAAAFVAVTQIVGAARGRDDAAELRAQMRRLRANALASNDVGYVDIKDLGGGRTRVFTATLEQGPAEMCKNPMARATSLEERDYDVELRISRSLCFEPQGFRLLAADQKTLAPEAVPIELAGGSVPDGGVPVMLSVTPSGTFAEPGGVPEGIAATINTPPAPDPAEPALNAVEPGELTPELPSTPPVPPAPTTPPGQPDIEPLADPPTLLPIGAACSVSSECASGHCSIGFCAAPGTGCVTDAECPDVEMGCDVGTGTCTKPCNSHLCPSAPHTCGGCQGATVCCTVYGCLCF